MDYTRLPHFWVDQIYPGVARQMTDQTWGVRYLEADYAWPHSTGEGCIAFILDTEASHFSHPDVAPHTIDELCTSFTGEESQGLGHHGLHVGHTVIQVAPGIKVVFVKVLDDSGAGSITNVIEGINYVKDLQLLQTKIINLSLGSNYSSPRLQAAIAAAAEAGILFCCAAGNDGKDVDFPGAYPTVIGVGAIDKNEQPAGFSSPGVEVDIACPGVDILAAWEMGYASLRGTSMATPHATGVSAILIAIRRDLQTFDQYYKFLTKYAKDLTTSGFDLRTGYGAPILKNYPLEKTSPPVPPPVPDIPKEKKGLEWWAWTLIGMAAVILILFILAWIGFKDWKLF